MESETSEAPPKSGEQSAPAQLPTEAPKNNTQRQQRDGQRGEKRKREDRGKGKGNFQQGGKRHKGRDMGRQEYFRQNVDKRTRNAEDHAKTQSRGRDDPKAHPFSKEEIEGESRQPKRKVAVMLGYAGSGYKGMQAMPDQKTIEGDLFAAFVKAGAISKANADDPKKSSFVRCARTDKGVHAAGNVISLKLIIEDPKVVEKINEALPDQIRIWGIERTIGSFSCYQACDSRWYEYLIPSHAFLPPHPKSWMGQKLEDFATEVSDTEGFHSRQEEVKGFWEKVDEEKIKPLLAEMSDEVREGVEKALYRLSADEKAFEEDDEDTDSLVDDEGGNDTGARPKPKDAEAGANEVSKAIEDAEPTMEEIMPEQSEELRKAIRQLKDAYISAKRAWRIPARRVERVQEVFDLYKGTHNFHNYTVRKSAKDPSAKRHILSFKVNPEPVVIEGTEWLSLKVHGQSFMMHQIRKMVGMVALVVRSGTDPKKIMNDSFGTSMYSIPKAPALGLLLERPVFDSYNHKAGLKFQKEEVGFTKYEDAMEEFKRKEIYARIFGEEQRDNVFHMFFSHVDNFRTSNFLYLSSKGLPACGEARTQVAEGKGDLSRRQRSEREKKNPRFGRNIEEEVRERAKVEAKEEGEKKVEELKKEEVGRDFDVV